MTLHPDILTDLVILYHAGEASQATRNLLETEAAANPQLAAAIAAPPREAAPLPAAPQDAGRVALREIGRLYRHRNLLVAVIAALLLILISALRLQEDYPWLPMATLALWWVVALIGLNVHKRLQKRL
jgi:hypothetical protein